MADVLSKEERKTLQESQFFIMGESRISTSTRPSSRNLNVKWISIDSLLISKKRIRVVGQKHN